MTDKETSEAVKEEKLPADQCLLYISEIGAKALQCEGPAACSKEVLGALIIKMHENRNATRNAVAASLGFGMFGEERGGLSLKSEVCEEASRILETHIKTSLGIADKIDKIDG